VRGWRLGVAAELEVVPGGVTAAAGFLAGAARCGLRKPGDPRPDLALVVSEGPAAAAGVFTRNRVQAAPVQVTREHLRRGRLRAVVANAGVANACTGERGLADARRMAAVAAESLGLAGPEEVAVASTGVIGAYLPLERVAAGIREAASRLGREGGAEAALAITTTDTRPKEWAVRLELEGRPVTVGGMAKGAGMIHPDLATMLCFLTTDADVAPAALREALARAVDRSFNMVTVDGDTSTNDCVLALASGAAGNPPLLPGTASFDRFAAALTGVCVALAREIARDGEGATRLIEVTVRGARDEGDARRAARTVAASNLVKAAVHGADANWGRILAALGRSGAAFDPSQVSVRLGGLVLVAGGCGAAFDEAEARSLLQRDEVRLVIDLGAGTAEATAWGCDLTADYVKINASYRS